MYKFLNEEHKQRYCEFIRDIGDMIAFHELEAWFYIISGCDDLYERRKEFYDYKTHRVKALDKSAIRMLCSSSKALVTLAYHIYENIEIESIGRTFYALDKRYRYLTLNSMAIAYYINI